MPSLQRVSTNKAASPLAKAKVVHQPPSSSADVARKRQQQQVGEMNESSTTQEHRYNSSSSSSPPKVVHQPPPKVVHSPSSPQARRKQQQYKEIYHDGATTNNVHDMQRTTAATTALKSPRTNSSDVASASKPASIIAAVEKTTQRAAVAVAPKVVHHPSSTPKARVAPKVVHQPSSTLKASTKQMIQDIQEVNDRGQQKNVYDCVELAPSTPIRTNGITIEPATMLLSSDFKSKLLDLNDEQQQLSISKGSTSWQDVGIFSQNDDTGDTNNGQGDNDASVNEEIKDGQEEDNERLLFEWVDNSISAPQKENSGVEERRCEEGVGKSHGERGANHPEEKKIDVIVIDDDDENSNEEVSQEQKENNHADNTAEVVQNDLNKSDTEAPPIVHVSTTASKQTTKSLDKERGVDCHRTNIERAKELLAEGFYDNSSSSSTTSVEGMQPKEKGHLPNENGAVKLGNNGLNLNGTSGIDGAVENTTQSATSATSNSGNAAAQKPAPPSRAPNPAYLVAVKKSTQNSAAAAAAAAAESNTAAAGSNLQVQVGTMHYTGSIQEMYQMQQQSNQQAHLQHLQHQQHFRQHRLQQQEMIRRQQHLPSHLQQLQKQFQPMQEQRDNLQQLHFQQQLLQFSQEHQKVIQQTQQHLQQLQQKHHQPPQQMQQPQKVTPQNVTNQHNQRNNVGAANVNRSDPVSRPPIPTAPANASGRSNGTAPANASGRNSSNSAKSNSLPALERWSEYRIYSAESITELEAIRHRLLTLLEKTNSRLKEMRVQKAVGSYDLEKLSTKELMEMLSKPVEGSSANVAESSTAATGEKRSRSDIEDQSPPKKRQRFRCCPLCLGTSHLLPDTNTVTTRAVTCTICEDDGICFKCYSPCLKCLQNVCSDCFATCSECNFSGYCFNCGPCCKTDKSAPKRAREKTGNEALVAAPGQSKQASRREQTDSLSRLPPPLPPQITVNQSTAIKPAQPIVVPKKGTTVKPPPLPTEITVKPNEPDYKSAETFVEHRFFFAGEVEKFGCIISGPDKSGKVFLKEIKKPSLAALHGIQEDDELFIPDISGKKIRDFFFKAATKEPRPMIFHVRRKIPSNVPNELVRHRFVVNEQGKLGLRIRREEGGTVISTVESGSVAEKIGICLGDIVCAVLNPANESVVGDIHELFLSAAKSSNRPFVFEVMRKQSVSPPSCYSFGDENPFLYRIIPEGLPLLVN